MPTDSKGKFHLNTQRMHASERSAAPKAKPMSGMTPKAAPKPKPMGGGAPSEPGTTENQETPQSMSTTTVHDHGDGTMHSEHEDGSVVEHPSVGHMAMHLAHHHEPDGKHMHIHEDGMGQHTTHHVGPDGEVQGPHQHGDMEAVKQHMDSAMGDGEAEGSDAGSYASHSGGMDGISGI